MNIKDMILLRLKHKVTAISEASGQEIWRTALPGEGIGGSGNFITLVCDDSRVFAYSSGHLHCLELSSGRLLWTNQLPKYGFGLASLCLPGCCPSPDAAVIQQLMSQQEAAAATTGVVAAS